MRVGIIGIQHESNTFHPEATELSHFREAVLVRGSALIQQYEGAFSEVSGFLEQLHAERIEPVPLLMAFAMPRGPVSDRTLDTLWRMIEEELEQAGNLDGFLLAPHGAGVSASHPDMDGWWLSALREKVGPKVPMVAVIDPHANLSLRMVQACDVVIAYQKNPHIDQKERGLEAAGLMARILRGEISPVIRASFPAACANIECHSTDESPMSDVARELNRIRTLPGVLTVSFLMGYPYADVFEMGCAFIVVTDRNPTLAETLCGELKQWLEKRSSSFEGRLVTSEEALELAIRSDRPVALMDMGDNIGGGAPGDSTYLLHLCARLSLRTFACLCDPEAAGVAWQSGAGTKRALRIGGKSSCSPAPPIEGVAEIISIHDGVYREAEARHGGQISFDMGKTAVAKVGSLTLMLTSRAVLPSSANQMIALGYHPRDFDLVILKGVHSPTAAYQEHCRTIIRANSPGITTADLRILNYRHRRKPLSPFESLSLP